MGEATRSPWRQLTDELAAGCAPSGIDLVWPLAIGPYNERVEPPHRLSDFGRPRSLAAVIGNTRALWPRFLQSLRDSPAALETHDPLEQYVERRVGDAVRRVAERWNVAVEVRWSHESSPAPVAMQQLAEVAGLAYLAPSHLSVHREFGPWIALRAAVVFDTEGPPGPALAAESPCRDCEHNCMAAFRSALAAVGGDPKTHASLEQDWELWLAVRDACPTGRAHRYPEEQIRYHYTKDLEVLRRAAR